MRSSFSVKKWTWTTFNLKAGCIAHACWGVYADGLLSTDISGPPWNMFACIWLIYSCKLGSLHVSYTKPATILYIYICLTRSLTFICVSPNICRAGMPFNLVIAHIVLLRQRLIMFGKPSILIISLQMSSCDNLAAINV